MQILLLTNLGSIVTAKSFISISSIRNHFQQWKQTTSLILKTFANTATKMNLES